MKTRWVIIFLFMGCFGRVKAQSFSEWFKQTKTQRKYLMQQIATLIVLKGLNVDGNDIWRLGLGMMGNIGGADSLNHANHFNSLKTVGSSVKQYNRIGEIVELQQQILTVYNHTNRQLEASQMLDGSTMDYVAKVFGLMLKDCAGLVSDLLTVTTSGKTAMTDKERIERIDQIYQGMQDNYAFTEGFGEEAVRMAGLKKQEQVDVAMLRKWYKH